MIYENDDQLQKDLAYWQKLLRLQDWDVYAKISRGRDLFTENSQASIRWVLPKKTATLQLMDPVDYDENIVEGQDHEVSLVHELLHLHYASFEETDDGSLAWAMMEQSIDAIAKALVSLRRKN